MKLFLSAISIAVILCSCAREGLNGKATIVVYPKHHSVPIINHVGYRDTIYVKFGTTDLPGTSPKDYDTYFVGVPRTDYINCSDLKWGNYYFYCGGYDSSTNSRVTGGVHVKIKQHDRKKTQNTDIAVTE